MNVTLPDGTVIRDVPDTITKAELTAKLKANGYDVAKLDASQAAPEPSLLSKAGQALGNVGAGLVRGAGSIGATLLAPVDAAARALGVQNDFIGRTDRREGMDGGLQAMGADPKSLAYQAGKLGGEVAGTAGAGGVLARGAAAIPGVAANAPGLINAIRTAGMVGGNGGAMANALTRAAGGAITGGASAGLVNPSDAGSGAAIGAILPGALQAAGKVGGKIGSVLRGPEQATDLTSAINAARAEGYVIPPTQARASLGNRLLEGFSGKLSTAQNASAKNQGITNELASKALGLPVDTKITPDVLQVVRQQAGKAYQAIEQAGAITPGPSYTKALDDIAASAKTAAQGFPNAKASPVIDLVDSLRSPTFDASSAVAKIKELRTAADDAFRAGNTDVARASRSAAGALEDAIESHLKQSGSTDVLQEFRDARQLIAKTYSVEKALNGSTGSVDARKLAAQLAKGKPLSGELKTAAEFAARFPKAAQALEGMGSLPQTSPLDYAAGLGGMVATANPLYLASIAARPAARAVALSGPVQNRLVQQPANSLALLANPGLRQVAYRTAPLTVTDR